MLGFTVTIPSSLLRSLGNICRYSVSTCYRCTCLHLCFAINNVFCSLPGFQISTFITSYSNVTLNLYNFNNNWLFFDCSSARWTFPIASKCLTSSWWTVSTSIAFWLVLLRYPKPTPKPRFFAKTARCRNLGFFCHNWRFLGSYAC